jgi:hypothetical protein
MTELMSSRRSTLALLAIFSIAAILVWFLWILVGSLLREGMAHTGSVYFAVELIAITLLVYSLRTMNGWIVIAAASIGSYVMSVMIYVLLNVLIGKNFAMSLHQLLSMLFLMPLHFAFAMAAGVCASATVLLGVS